MTHDWLCSINKMHAPQALGYFWYKQTKKIHDLKVNFKKGKIQVFPSASKSISIQEKLERTNFWDCRLLIDSLSYYLLPTWKDNKCYRWSLTTIQTSWSNVHSFSNSLSYNRTVNPLINSFMRVDVDWRLHQGSVFFNSGCHFKVCQWFLLKWIHNWLIWTRSINRNHRLEPFFLISLCLN